MKFRGIHVIIILLFTIPSFISSAEKDEKITVQIALITPTGNQLHEKTMSLDKAEQLFKLCKTYHHNPADNEELIKRISGQVIQNQKELSYNSLKNLLTPPIKIQRNYCIKKQDNVLSPSATEMFCSISSGGSGRTFPFFLLPRPRLFLLWNGNSQNDIAGTTVGSLVRDRGFIALGGQSGIALGFIGIGFSYGTPAGRVYAFSGYCLFTNVQAEYIETFYPMNRKPIISNPSPANNKQQVSLALSELSFFISDPDKDFMSYMITTDPYIGIGSGNLKLDGTYSIPISNLNASTDYSWTIKVDDGKETTSETYTFKTVMEKPIISNPAPTDQSSTSSDLSSLEFTISDAQGNLMDYTVETNPDIGFKDNKNVGNGTINVPVSGLTDDCWYHWYVNVTDGTFWSREKFSFYTGDLNLIGFWTFDEGVGNIAYDSSGLDHHGDLHGPTWINGKYGNALYFDGDDYIALNEITDLKVDLPVAISAWIKPSNFVSSEERQQIFLNDRWKQTGISNYNGVRLSVTNDGEIITAFGDGGNGESGRRTKISDEKIQINNWYHIVGVIKGPTDMDIYINGKIIVGEYTGSGGSIYYTNSPGRIGSNTDNQYYFNGIIDELRVYDRILSENEIISLYENSV